MEQHPIPQQISSYQFKLVGDMTLKQFFQIAGGVIVGLIFYSTPLHPLIKWPFILFFTLLGIALAFLPFEERPLEKWIIAFFRSIYSPTLYTWKKTEKPPVFYTESAPAPTTLNTTALANVSKVVDTNTTKLEEAEQSFLSKIGGLWNVSSQPATQPSSNSTTTTPLPQSVTPVVQNIVPTPTISAMGASVPKPEMPIVPVSTQTFTNPTVQVPRQTPITIPKTAPKFVVEESGSKAKQQTVQTTTIDTPKEEVKPITEKLVEFSVDAAPPSPPIVINTVVGQVMDQDRKIVEGAILEIKDSSGRPVRALKSNKAGHFIIVTPLSNGKYEITVEKEGFKFDPVAFETKGAMIDPIAIKGTRN